MKDDHRKYHDNDIRHPDYDELDIGIATILLWLIMIAVIVFAVTRYLAT